MTVASPDRSAEGWIQTYMGVQFYPMAARAEDVRIEDIAHALANTARFGGHTQSFYSVAQHSVLVSEACNPEDALWGLLHDAAEAYLGDVPRPIKHSPFMSAFRLAEEVLMGTIAAALNLPGEEPESVKWADGALLATEKRDLMFGNQTDMSESDWLHGARATEALHAHIIPWLPADAEWEFYHRYKELTR